jgi:hypothetical protein
LEDVGSFDIDPIKLKPTWRNKGVGMDRVVKILDVFLSSKTFLEGSIKIKQWVILGGDCNHFPMLLSFGDGRGWEKSSYTF